jgi:hypothetical protein
MHSCIINSELLLDEINYHNSFFVLDMLYNANTIAWTKAMNSINLESSTMMTVLKAFSNPL